MPRRPRPRPRQTAGRNTATTVMLCAAALGSFVGLGTAQEQGKLPQEVAAWMQRDQVQRWTVLLKEGEKRFSEGSCARCHGEGGKAGRFGPDLTDSEWGQGDGSLASIGEIIFWGVRRKDFADPSRRFEMNPSGGMQLDREDLAALTAYVWSLSHGTQLSER